MANQVINIVNKIRMSDGFRITWGAFTAAAVLLILMHVSALLFPSPYDDSDAPPLRSGLSIRTDYKTGCQYFATFIGSITPRMDASGRQIPSPPRSAGE